MPDPTTTQGALRLPREVRFGYGSRQLTADLVRARGSRVLALVDREEGGRAAIKGRGYPVRALFTAGELLGRSG